MAPVRGDRGLIYLLAFIAGHRAIMFAGRPGWLMYEGTVGSLLVAAATQALPAPAVFRSTCHQLYSARTSGLLRLAFYSWLLVALGLLRAPTDGRSTF